MAIRADAQKQPIDRGEAILPELERARAGASGEIASRLADIIDTLRWWDRTCWGRSALVDVTTGREVWRVRPDPPWRDFESAVSEREVTICFHDGRMERRSLKDGKLLWSTPPLAPADLTHEGIPRKPVLVSTPQAVVRCAVNSVRATDPATGRELWSIPLEVRSYETIFRKVALGHGWMILMTSGNVISIDLATGRKRWVLEEWINGATVLRGGDVGAATTRRVARLRAEDGSQIYFSVSPASSFPGLSGALTSFKLQVESLRCDEIVAVYNSSPTFRPRLTSSYGLLAGKVSIRLLIRGASFLTTTSLFSVARGSEAFQELSE